MPSHFPSFLPYLFSPLFTTLFTTLFAYPFTLSNKPVLHRRKQQSHDLTTFSNQIATTVKDNINQEYGRNQCPLPYERHSDSSIEDSLTL